MKKIVLILWLLPAWTVFPQQGRSFYDYDFPIHSMDRPAPFIIEPAINSTGDQSGKAPSDALVLFDSDDLSAWRTGKDEPADWKVKGDFFECVPGKSSIYTKQGFGDCQLHVEWASPAEPEGKGQGRGNSGVFLMGLYEVQVLDSYENSTYPDGQAAALYGQQPPQVNACRKPGEWQTFDIIFRRPRFNPDGSVRKAAIITVFHNGVLVHDHVKLSGPTTHQIRLDYHPHPERLPLSLQDHSNPVRFRNIWIRDLEKDSPEIKTTDKPQVSESDLDTFAGVYRSKTDSTFKLTISRTGDDKLKVEQVRRDDVVFKPQSWRGFFAPVCQMQMVFQHNKGEVTGLRFAQDGSVIYLEKIK